MAFNMKPGCCCTSGTTFCITACSPAVALVGATVTVAGKSCTTVAGGCCSIAGLSSGSQLVTVVYGGSTIFNSFRSITAGGTVNINVASPTGSVCCGNCVIPDTLFVTDANGTHTAAWDATLSKWAVCYLLSVSGVSASGSSPTCVCSSAGTISLPVNYWLTCQSASNSLSVEQAWPGICCACGSAQCFSGLTGPYSYYQAPNGCAFRAAGISGCQFCTSGVANPFTDAASATIPWSSCSPFSLSGTLSGGSFTAAPGGTSVVISS